jgi:hypothetical protein
MTGGQAARQENIYITLYIMYNIIQRVLNDLERIRISRRRMIWLLPHTLSRQQVVSLSRSSCVSSVEFTDGRGGSRGGEEPNQETARKPWSSINHKKLSDTLFSMITYSKVFALGEPTFQSIHFCSAEEAM